MSKENNFIIIGTAPNYDELINGEHFRIYLERLSETHTIIGLNEVLTLPSINVDLLDIIMTIDYYTWEYLKQYPQLQDKMWVDITLKKYLDKKGITDLKDIKSIFKVDKTIHREYNDNKLFLNKEAPTVLHSALNLCLKKAIENNCLENTTVNLWGIQLSEKWDHTYKRNSTTKRPFIIENMRRSVYIFEQFFKLNTLNKDTTLKLGYKNILDLVKL